MNKLEKVTKELKEIIGNDDCICLLDGANGRYIPKLFASDFGLLDDYPELADPDNEYYWDAWENLVNDLGDYLMKYDLLLHEDDGLFLMTEEYFEKEFQYI